MFYLAIILELKYYNEERYDVVNEATYSGHAKAPIFPVLSFLSAIMKAAMLMPVASAISQSKWIWFRRERKLAHLDRFDEASRGILGSLRLLFTVRFSFVSLCSFRAIIMERCGTNRHGRSFVAIGALLTRLSLPTDAFIQSSVLLNPKRIVNKAPFPLEGNITVRNEIYLSRTTKYTGNPTQVMTTEEERWPESDMINGIDFGISYMNGLQDTISKEIPINYPTGGCNFGRYQTLGVDSFCINRSLDIKITPKGQNYTLPGPGLSLRKEIRSRFPQGLISAESTNGTGIDRIDDFGPIIVRTSLLVNM